MINLSMPRYLLRIIEATRSLAIALLLSLFALSTNAIAATQVVIENNTSAMIEVIKLSVDGDPLSKKAWKKGKAQIAAGQDGVVLSINRTGKFNWMDPTPRFIEPGKTAFFTIELRIQNSTFTPPAFKQKLLGTGSGSRLWYLVETTEDTGKWTLPFTTITGVFEPDIKYVYRAIKTDKDDNLQIIIGSDNP